MKTKLKQTAILLVGILLFSACTGQPSMPQSSISKVEKVSKVEEAEIDKYEKTYMAEYEQIKQKNADYKMSFKWIQPKNKKEECKIWVGYNPNDDKTIKSNYSLFWDGDCKNGYAYGIGREIENTMLSNLQQIGYYENGKAKDYCVIFNSLEGVTIDRECSYNFNKPDHFVRTLINEKNGDLQIVYVFGVEGYLEAPTMFIKTSPFSDVVEYYKIYPNFAYRILDFSKNEFDNRKYQFDVLNKDGKPNGFGFVISKKGHIVAGEMKNGILIRKVKLPQSYLNKANSIFSEIQKEAEIALKAQKKALIIKEKYKKKICKDSVKVNFMDNDEYKAICHEDEYYAKLKQKIDAKLAQIEKQKQAKRVQLQQERLIKAREMEAMAAQGMMMQNILQLHQLQRLNDNMMMYNFMPKTHHIYLHY